MSLAPFITQLGAEIDDASEETFLLFSQDIPSQNLGIIDSQTPLLELSIGSRDLSIKQSPTVLNSARGGGTTGAVVWKVTPRFAEWLISPGNTLAQHGIVSRESSVLELGSGIAGIVPLALAPLVQQYIATDQAYALKLLKENIDQNTTSTQTRTKNKKPSKRANAVPSSNIQIESLDWETDDVDSFLKSNNAPEGPEQEQATFSKQPRHRPVTQFKLALTSSVKKQFSYRSLFFFSLALVLLTVAFTRIASRLSLLTTHFTPLKLPTGLASTRNITSMTMASAKYQKPPQAPPLFTATIGSLAKDTKRLLDQSRRIQDQIVNDITPESANFHNVVLPMALDDNKMAIES
ncbi:hypothetical protein KCU94_g9069, partial [Aureobasidium melanogenum]